MAFSSAASPVQRPYAQASAAERAQLLAHVRQRLGRHFPTLPPAAWLRALFEFQPMLLLPAAALSGQPAGPARLSPQELTQLAQHVAAAPELLPPLDPPLYGPAALTLAQALLHYRELAAAALPGLLVGIPPPPLRALLLALLEESPVANLAEQVTQAWRWDLASAPTLPAGVVGGAGPAPASAELHRYLAALRRAA